MSHFSLKTFLRKTPYTLIQYYFKSKKLLEDYNWGSGLDLERLTAALSAIGDAGEVVLCDFERVHDIANDAGIDNLIEQAVSPIHNLNIGRQLAEMDGHHEQAMFVFLHHPNLFRWTSEMIYVDSLATSSWKTCVVGYNYQFADSDELRQKLGDAIAGYYRQQGRGKNCTVDYYFRINPERHCFFAYPENYATEDLTYEDRNKLVRRIRRPVMEVIFVYDRESGRLYVHARGDKFAKKLQEIFCKEALELDGIPDENTKVYDLEVLKDANFRFVTDPAHDFEFVMLKAVEIRLKGTSKKIILEANPADGTERVVFDMMNQAAQAFGVHLNAVFVKRAKIAAKFHSTPFVRGRSITFFVAYPNVCTLSDVRHHNIIKRYLDRWGFVKNLLSEEDAA